VRFSLQLRQHNPCLLLVLPGFISVAGFARLVALEEEYLAQAFIGIDLGWQRGAVGNFQRHKAFPLGLKGRYVHNNAAARIGGFSDADGQHVARDFEIFH
jgi:hypothetical protein